MNIEEHPATAAEISKMGETNNKPVPIPPVETSNSGDRFSLLARQYGMVTLKGTDVPRSLRYDVPS